VSEMLADLCISKPPKNKLIYKPHISRDDSLCFFDYIPRCFLLAQNRTLQLKHASNYLLHARKYLCSSKRSSYLLKISFQSSKRIYLKPQYILYNQNLFKFFIASQTMKKDERDLEDIVYCNYSCKHIRFEENPPLCQTFDLVYCKKYKIEMNKGSLYLDHNSKFQEVWRKNKK
jgi:hypothetical protein